MRNESGQSQGPQLIIHGGAGPVDPKGDHIDIATTALRGIGSALFEDLQFGRDAMEVALECIKMMETNELFNAGRGSARQQDGGIRMSAAVMESRKQAFSGVMGVEHVLHPSQMAFALQNEKSRVLGPPGTETLARRLGLPVVDCATAQRTGQWVKNNQNASDTVGCVIRGQDGRLVAMTSTGGTGNETPGRESDAATVAGTYCSDKCAISATGIGEQIVDDALAARLETRVRDGQLLRAASTKCYEEAIAKHRHYGWIAVDRHGWSVCHTTLGMTFVVYGESGELFASGG